ncbi:MAG: DUF560 domain-containing protein [Simplicispira suum]|uniref:surface lipoprotein assembly modifier n=1 Tax=Simplicispira suum TaxID=2109915 RepID=UPI001C6D1062|nr:surface lipoprotein assembly modifier [Simplicispira suum]MBW7833343.1 DUF560 domain-containing protein [Simplicispira suum]
MIIPRGLPRSRWLFFAPLLGLALSQPAQADALLDDAQTLSAQGNAEQAFVLLGEQEPVRAGDPSFDAAMGRAAHAAGHYTRAVMAWERVLAAQPDDLDAQVQLGRALQAVGDRRGMRALSAQARARVVPVDAALSIDQFLESYDRRDANGGSSAKAYVELGAGHDSNANAGSATMLASIPNPAAVAWSLDPSALGRSANFVNAAASLRGRYVLDARWSLVGAVTAAARRHGERARPWDFQHIDGSAGLAWRSERNEFIVSGQGDFYALDGAHLRSFGGVLGEWIYHIDGFRQWDSFAQWLQLNYPTQSARDVQRSVFGTTYSQVFRNGSIGWAGAWGGREEPRGAGQTQWGHRLVGLRAGAQLPLGRQWALYAHAEWEQRHYGAQDPFFAQQRRDRQTDVSLGLSWVPAANWRITPEWTLTRNASTLAVNTYERKLFSVTVRREF